METGGGGDGGHGFSCGNTYNNFHFYNLQNHHSLFQATPPTTALDRFLWGENNNQLAQYPQTTLPLSLVQNNGFSSYCNPNNSVLDSSNVPPQGLYGYNYDQNGGVSWPSQVQLNLSHGESLNMEHIEWNERKNILDHLRENLDLCKKNGGGSGKNGKSDPLCLIKGQWTEEEDRRLIELVNKHGVKKWVLISEGMCGRAGKQCRERWHNHLRSNIKKEPWSEAEERLLVETHKKLDNRWAEIAKTIPGRTENSIKNHWNATKRKLDSRKRGKRQPKQNENNKLTILQAYIMSYYAKKTTTHSSISPTITPSPPTITPSMDTSEAMPTYMNPKSNSSSTFGSIVMSTEFDMLLADMSDSINDQDNHSTSILSYDQDELNFIENVFDSNASVGSSSFGSSSYIAKKPKVCHDKTLNGLNGNEFNPFGVTKVRSTEQQVFQGDMKNEFYGLSCMDSKTLINTPKEHNWNVQSTRPDRYLANLFDNGVISFSSFYLQH